MNRRARAVLLAAGLAGLGVLLVAALVDAPGSGRQFHPYGEATTAIGLLRERTPNIIASINFDQRAFDTLGEEFLLFATILGAVVLLRPAPDEHRGNLADAPETLDAVRVLGTLLLPVVTLVGIYVTVTGHLSVGGGFQGGVILATALHLLFLAGDYRALQRVRPLPLIDVGEALGAVAYIGIGLVALATGGVFLQNTLPLGSFNTLTSAGTVDLFNLAVGLEVACAMVLLLGEFFDQTLVLEEESTG